MYGSSEVPVPEYGAEAVVPLEKNTGWIKKLAEKIVSSLDIDDIDFGSIKGGLKVGKSGGYGSQYYNDTKGNTIIDAGMTVNYNGKLSRKELKRIENDNYKAIKLRLKKEGAI